MKNLSPGKSFLLFSLYLQHLLKTTDKYSNQNIFFKSKFLFFLHSFLFLSLVAILLFNRKYPYKRKFKKRKFLKKNLKDFNYLQTF